VYASGRRIGLLSESVQVVEKTADLLAVLIPPLHTFVYAIFATATLALVLAVSLRNSPAVARLFL
jgi:hypothetical protein